MASGRFFRQLRILVLLLVLFVVAMDAWLMKVRSTDWDEPLWVVVYPVNGDGSDVTARYIDSLHPGVFAPIAEFLDREAGRKGLSQQDLVKMKLGPEVDSRPPAPPHDRGIPGVMWWSLRLRYWAWQIGREYSGPPADIRLFVVYHDPAMHVRLDHSLGLQKGLIGVVNAFASPSMSSRNNVVIAHEILHTLGATDKYDPATNQPLFPAGYAEPARTPLHPQVNAEIMGGRIPVTASTAEMPPGLGRVVVGEATALEINWVE